MRPSLGLDLCLGRQLDTSLRAHKQIDRSDELEHRVVLNALVAILDELVSVDQLGQEDLDLLQSKVETNAHTLTSRTCSNGCSYLVLRRNGPAGETLIFSCVVGMALESWIFEHWVLREA